METRLDGKVALVTGGSRGIGLETAAEMLRSGVEGVVITSRRPENLQEAVRELVAGGAEAERVHAIAARADVDEDAERAVAEAVAHFGACDILINNAGTNPSAGALMDVDLGALDKTWAVNQRAPLVWARQTWHHWMKDHGGVIVNVASVGGLRPSPLIGAYNISKAALVFMTHQLAFELAPTVRVNAVAPAVVKTRLSEMLWKYDEETAAGTHPLNRLGEPEDVAQAIAYLASDAARWITGVVFPIDGGVVGATGGLA